MNRRKPNFAPANLTEITKATLADLLWHFATLDGSDTEESAWGAIDHAAKQIGKMPASDLENLRTMARARRKRQLIDWRRKADVSSVQGTLEHRAAHAANALMSVLAPNELAAARTMIGREIRRLRRRKT